MGSVKNRILSVLMILLIVQISVPVSAASPASIQIEPHTQSVSADQVVRFTAVVKDSSGSTINEVVNWSVNSGTIDSTGMFTPGEVGRATVTATSGGVNSTTTIDVTAGRAVDIQSNITVTEVSIDDEIDLNATLIDRAGNPVLGQLVWRCQNGEIDYQNNTWSPDEVGNATMRIMHLELEIQVVFKVVAGSPESLEIPYGLTVQSGMTVHIIPTVRDSMGNEVDISKAGTLTWAAENGSISPTGLYFGNYPGLWNITVDSTSGASGSGFVRVLPAQATGLSIEINSTEARTGTPISISAIRTDILGNSGEVILPLSNWTVTTGSLAMDGDSVIWTPSLVGEWTIAVTDQGYSTTIQVDVIQGLIVGIEILLSEEELRSGDSIVASLSAYDAAGNSKSVNGAWMLDSELGYQSQGSWMQLQPGLIGNYSISATWFDNETQIVHEIDIVTEVVPGELSRIILPESGTRVTSDGVLDLLPLFEDEYGNRLDGILVDWIVDDNDMTMEIRLADNKWAPSALGMHELRAMAQGVFAITNIEVVAGIARHITTDYDEGIDVASGEDIEITISTLDVHGNIALASIVEFEFEDPEGVIAPSSKGDGIWTVEGGEVGEWNLRITSGSASHDIEVVVTPGEAVRLLADIPAQNPEEGGTMVIRIYAIDQVGNRVEVPSSEIDIQCTTGSVRHLSADTYEVTIDQSGPSQSCNFYWNDLVAQRFFDVDAVLFGGGLGDSNTALTLVSIIIFLFISIMFVLMRRMKGQGQEGQYWDDEENYEDEDEVEEEIEAENIQSETPAATESTTPEETNEESTEELRARLASEAKRTGVMQAAPGTQQGKTGWYIDSSGELTSWLVSESGEWTRMS